MTNPESDNEGVVLDKIHTFLYDTFCKQFIDKYKSLYTFHHINPIKGLAPAFKKFTNSLILLLLMPPKKTQASPLEAILSRLNYEDPDESNETEMFGDLDDIFNSLSKLPVHNNDTADIPSQISLKFSWHGTPTLDAAKSILRNGYDPKARRRTVYGVGEYHTHSLDIAESYAGKNWVICNCVITKNFNIVNEDLFFVTENPKSFHSVTYMLPLYVFSMNGQVFPVDECCLPNATP